MVTAYHVLAAESLNLPPKIYAWEKIVLLKLEKYGAWLPIGQYRCIRAHEIYREPYIIGEFLRWVRKRAKKSQVTEEAIYSEHRNVGIWVWCAALGLWVPVAQCFYCSQYKPRGNGWIDKDSIRA